MLARVKFESRNMVSKINSLSPMFFILAAFSLAAFGFALTYHYQSTTGTPLQKAVVLTATWNMAAVNNNPFEYWITYDKDPSYEQIMEQVSNFIRSPGAADVEVSSVFTDAMFDELFNKMETVTTWTDLQKVKDVWNNDYKGRKIISGFLTDGLLGKKRLTSMPDRVTNTMHDPKLGRNVMRPTVINCYQGADLTNFPEWWKQWLEFMFSTSVATSSGAEGAQKPIWQMLETIKTAKYPSLTAEEEAISKPLQTVAVAIFDAVLVHMMNQIAPTKWQSLRQEMCENLNTKKNDISAAILSEVYSDYDVVFLQEVSKAFVEIASSSSYTLPASLAASHPAAVSKAHSAGHGHSESTVAMSQSAVTGAHAHGHSNTMNVLHRNYHIHAPASIAAGTNSRDQNSVILLRRHRYRDVHDITAEVMEDFKQQASAVSGATKAAAEPHAGSRTLSSSSSSKKKKIAVEDGDLLVLSALDNVTGYKYIFASFHGDTNGLATIPVLSAVYSHAINKRPDHRLLFGMDANTYEHADEDQQGVTSFADFYTSKKLNSCYGRKPNPKNYTTFHARTYLQSQLNKAVSLEERSVKGDKNPKDFIVFFDSDFSVLWTRKDNTGKHAFVENMIFPTLAFPSDHAVTSTLLIEKSATSAPPPAVPFYGASSSNFRAIPDVEEEHQ